MKFTAQTTGKLTMHWNQIEYAKGEVVEVLWFREWRRGEVVGVCVRPSTETKYYVRLENLTAVSEAAQIRRVQQ